MCRSTSHSWNERGGERRGDIGLQWFEGSKVHHGTRGGLLINEDEPCQRFIGRYMIRAGAS